jgi:hypothetical protein
MIKKDVWNRRVIVVATDVEIDGLEHDPQGIDLLNNEEVMILPVNDAKGFNSNFELLGGSRIEPRMILVMSPIDDNTYVEISEARTHLAIDKALKIVRFFTLLGATSIKVTEIKLVDLSSKKELTIGGGVEGHTTGNLKVSNEMVDRLKNEIRISSTSIGGKPLFDKAEKLMRENKLNSDPLLSNTFEMIKDYDGETQRIKSINEHISLTQSMQNTFNMVSKINFPAGMVDMGYESTVKKNLEIYMGIEVNFQENTDKFI